MSSPIVIGSSVLYDHASAPGAGVWSGVVTNIFRQDDKWWASVTFDGVVVPPMNRCGIKGQWGLAGCSDTADIDVTSPRLTLRSPQEDDDEKRQQWQKKVRQYTDCQNAISDMKHVAEVQRFSHVTPGMPVTWIMNAAQFADGAGREPRTKCHFKGVISKIRKNGVQAYVTGTETANPEATPQTVCLYMEQLTFI